MKNLLLSLVFVNTYMSVIAQNMAKDVFIKEEIVWFGLDFSKSKMVGQFDQGGGAAPASGSDIKSKYVSSWNGVIVNEQEKYNLKKTFRKTTLVRDLAVVEKSNSKIDPDNFLTYNDYKFKDADETVAEIIGSYTKGEQTDGIGLVFIVEYFSKIDQKASIYVTFFDITTKKVLFKEHLFGKPGGFGLRNYWVGTIYDILKQIDSGNYKSWKNKYDK